MRKEVVVINVDGVRTQGNLESVTEDAFYVSCDRARYRFELSDSVQVEILDE